jgi:hypothetical protein
MRSRREGALAGNSYIPLTIEERSGRILLGLLGQEITVFRLLESGSMSPNSTEKQIEQPPGCRALIFKDLCQTGTSPCTN